MRAVTGRPTQLLSLSHSLSLSLSLTHFLTLALSLSLTLFFSVSRSLFLCLHLSLSLSHSLSQPSYSTVCGDGQAQPATCLGILPHVGSPESLYTVTSTLRGVTVQSHSGGPTRGSIPRTCQREMEGQQHDTRGYDQGMR